MKKSSNQLKWILYAALAVLIIVQQVRAFSGGFMRSLNDRPWAVSTVSQPVRAGQISHQFQLRQGDCGAQPGWSDCEQDRERIEFSQRPPWINLDQTIWVSYSIMLDAQWPDLTPVTTTLGQFHHRDSGTPALLFTQRDGYYWVRIESARSLYPQQRQWPLASVDSMRGRWTDVVIEARFSAGDQGVFRVWVNGRLALNLQGPNTLGTTPLFFKWGIYRSFVSRREHRPTHVAWWDEVRSGPTRAHVDPAVNPHLRPRD